MIIDTDNYAQHGIETFTFAGGEHHCKVPKLPSRVVHIHAKIRSAYDWMTLKVVCDALHRNLHELYLFMPYLPGARQDRVTSPGSPLTVEIYAKDLVDMVEHVTVVDIHSRAAEDIMRKVLGDRFTHMMSHWMLPGFVPRPDYVIAPDEGAVNRANNAAFSLGGLDSVDRIPVVKCTKKRDPATGELSGFHVPDLSDGENRYLIVDDICDGGGTFVGLLEEFRKQSDEPVDLWVTHGIFSKGLDALDGFDNVYTTDSFYQPNKQSPKLHVLPLINSYLEGLTP